MSSKPQKIVPHRQLISWSDLFGETDYQENVFEGGLGGDARFPGKHITVHKAVASYFHRAAALHVECGTNISIRKTELSKCMLVRFSYGSWSAVWLQRLPLHRHLCSWRCSEALSSTPGYALRWRSWRITSLGSMRATMELWVNLLFFFFSQQSNLFSV